MKKRIWKRLVSAGCALLLETGIFMGCTVQPVAAETALGEARVMILENSGWIDLDDFKAELQVQALGLENLEWKETETEENEGALEGRVSGILTEKYILEVWISEYFLLASSASLPSDCTYEEIPVYTRDGRESTVSRVQWEIYPGESRKELDLLLDLRNEYHFSEESRKVSVCQDAPLEKGKNENNCAGGIFIRREFGEEKEIICETTSQMLEIPGTKAGFSLNAQQRGERNRAGERVYCDVELWNPDSFSYYDINLEASTEKENWIPVWEKEAELELTQKGAMLKKLGSKEKRTLSFYVDIPENEKGETKLLLTAQPSAPFILERKKELPVVIQPLKAAFTVKKTADCKTAGPGDTITYQISIHNTGEQTLHSVITTERFALAGVHATFLEQEGITLNRSKTQAKIPKIVPGGCVKLKAKVILPENLKEKELINQVIVVSDETGEEQAVRDQAVIKVKEKETENGGELNKTGNNDQNASWQRNSRTPKTGDRSHKELFQALILCSLALSVLAARRMFFGRND